MFEQTNEATINSLINKGYKHEIEYNAFCITDDLEVIPCKGWITSHHPISISEQPNEMYVSFTFDKNIEQEISIRWWFPTYPEVFIRQRAMIQHEIIALNEKIKKLQYIEGKIKMIKL